MLLLARLGLRAGEVAGLTLQDLDCGKRSGRQAASNLGNPLFTRADVKGSQDGPNRTASRP